MAGKKLKTLIASPSCEITLNGKEYEALLIPKEPLVIMDYTKHPELMPKEDEVKGKFVIEFPKEDLKGIPGTGIEDDDEETLDED